MTPPDHITSARSNRNTVPSFPTPRPCRPTIPLSCRRRILGTLRRIYARLPNGRNTSRLPWYTAPRISGRWLVCRTSVPVVSAYPATICRPRGVMHLHSLFCIPRTKRSVVSRPKCVSALHTTVLVGITSAWQFSSLNGRTGQMIVDDQ